MNAETNEERHMELGPTHRETQNKSARSTVVAEHLLLAPSHAPASCVRHVLFLE